MSITPVQRTPGRAVTPQVAEGIVPFARKHRGRKTGKISRRTERVTAGNPFAARTQGRHAQGVPMRNFIERTMQPRGVKGHCGVAVQTRVPQRVGNETGEAPCAPGFSYCRTAQKLVLIGR